MEADPSVRGWAGDQPSSHAMCGAKEKSWEYVFKILDFALGEFPFGGVHLESADQGWCSCSECAGKYGPVGYNSRLNIRCADYIKKKWPDKIVTSIPINWLNVAISQGRYHFNAEEEAEIIELSKHIDCFMDQGHSGTFVAPEDQKRFIKKLHSDYGTSGGLWLYPDIRWDRAAYFLPYVKRTCEAIKQLYDNGGRGCMFYQGPVINPSTEVNIAAGGRILSDVSRSVEDVLSEVIKLYYKPRSPAAHKKLVELFLLAEDCYFSQWSPKLFMDIWKCQLPGEFKLDQNLFGTSPGPATFLVEPVLDAKGRQEYKKGLVSILEELPKIENSFNDGGRIERIKRGVISTLTLLNTVAYCKGG